MDAGIPRKKQNPTGVGTADETTAQTTQFISVRIVCGACGNLNRKARRACHRCNRTGFEGTRQIEQKPGEPLKLGGVMPDMDKFAPPESSARSLQPSKP